jgi:hypothetical protein
MVWGGLNPALTAWRTAVMRRFPDKDARSDGGRADAAHGSTSQHQEDSDGTVDAYDMDVNLLKGSPGSGTPEERRLIEAMKLDFEQDPHGRSKLWIHNREIASRVIGDWRERPYTGASPHTEHVHWEARQEREDDGRTWPMPHTDALLREKEEDMAFTDTDGDALVKKVRGTREFLSDTQVMIIGQDAAGRVAPALGRIEVVLARIEAALKQELADVAPSADQNAAAVIAALGARVGETPETTAAKIRAALTPVLGDRADDVFRLLGEQA